MSGETIHLMVRETDDGLYATSPQARGLVYGRPDLATLRDGLVEVLAAHLRRPGPFDIVEHHERHYDVAGRELVTRLALDARRDERQDVYARIGRALMVPEQATLLVEQPANRLDEIVYICTVPSDTVSWLAAQMDGEGDRAIIALAIADPFVMTVPIAVPGHQALEVDGTPYPARATVAEIVRAVPIVQPVHAERTLAS